MWHNACLAWNVASSWEQFPRRKNDLIAKNNLQNKKKFRGPFAWHIKELTLELAIKLIIYREDNNVRVCDLDNEDGHAIHLPSSNNFHLDHMHYFNSAQNHAKSHSFFSCKKTKTCWCTRYSWHQFWHKRL